MNYDYIKHHRVRLATRNEGKIKSYESCQDLRAWSHDIRTRDRYLRDWIKCDMPTCVVPVCTLASILTVMACRRRRKVGSRCHHSCKSKVLLDSISSSCSILKDCLRDKKEFEKYFREEELETIHWPCEKCLDILKNIKVFWKIVAEKVLKIQIPTSETKFKNVSSSIQNVAKEWKKDIIQEAIYVKSTSILANQNGIKENIPSDCQNRSGDKERKLSKFIYQNKATETDCTVRTIGSQKDGNYVRKKISKCTSTDNFEVDKPIHVCKEKKINEELLLIYKSNIQNLQQQFDLQKSEIRRLEKENTFLNIELQNSRQNNIKNSLHCDPSLRIVDNTIALVSSGFTNNSEEKFDVDPAKNIDSEMVITLKNCTNENFRNVSTLQVLHKTNGRIFNIKESTSCCRQEDPIHLLSKVHKTFGAIVRREISIATKTKGLVNDDVEIKTTFRNNSCSTSSLSATSECNFESAKETSDTMSIV